MTTITKKEKELIWFALRFMQSQNEPADAEMFKKLIPIFNPHTDILKYKCSCGWEGKDHELSVKTFRNGGDESVCPLCGDHYCDEILRTTEEEMTIVTKIISEGDIIP